MNIEKYRKQIDGWRPVQMNPKIFAATSMSGIIRRESVNTKNMIYYINQYNMKYSNIGTFKKEEGVKDAAFSS